MLSLAHDPRLLCFFQRLNRGFPGFGELASDVLLIPLQKSERKRPCSPSPAATLQHCNGLMTGAADGDHPMRTTGSHSPWGEAHRQQSGVTDHRITSTLY
jgi:hypothetical protein